MAKSCTTLTTKKIRSHSGNGDAIRSETDFAAVPPIWPRLVARAPAVKREAARVRGSLEDPRTFR